MTTPHAQPTREKKCKACGGTGYLLLDRSWFIQDGYTRIRCWHAAETNAEFIRYQRKKRDRVAMWGGLKPPPHMCNERGVVLEEYR